MAQNPTRYISVMLNKITSSSLFQDMHGPLSALPSDWWREDGGDAALSQSVFRQ